MLCSEGVCASARCPGRCDCGFGRPCAEGMTPIPISEQVPFARLGDGRRPRTGHSAPGATVRAVPNTPSSMRRATWPARNRAMPSRTSVNALACRPSGPEVLAPGSATALFAFPSGFVAAASMAFSVSPVAAAYAGTGSRATVGDRVMKPPCPAKGAMKHPGQAAANDAVSLSADIGGGFALPWTCARTHRTAIWMSLFGARSSWVPGFPLRGGACCPRGIQGLAFPVGVRSATMYRPANGGGDTCGRVPVPCCPSASVRRAGFAGNLTSGGLVTITQAEMSTRDPASPPLHDRCSSGSGRRRQRGVREPVGIPVNEATVATFSPAMPEVSGDALPGVLRAFRNLRRGVLTSVAASRAWPPQVRRIAGSPGLRTAARP